jgi:hypothetical protein
MTYLTDTVYYSDSLGLLVPDVSSAPVDLEADRNFLHDEVTIYRKAAPLSARYNKSAEVSSISLAIIS